jgi:predicted enzyme related to lactoylglutathione lyase
MGGGYRYTLLKNGEKDVGGLAAPPADRDVPPSWLTYITVDDVDAAAARVPSLGGSVLMAPYDVPTIGRVAIVADPQGGKFAAFQSLTPGATDTTPATHSFCWAAIVAKNADAIVPFYTSLFGWTPSPMGEPGHVLFSRGEEMVGSTMQSADTSKPTQWLNYVAVEDLGASTKKAQAAGAELVYGPVVVPNQGSYAVVTDPTGAMVALWQAAAA